MNQVNDDAKSFGAELRLDQAEKGVTVSLPAGVPHVTVRGVVCSQDDVLETIRGFNAPWKEAREAHAVLRRFTAQKARLTKEVASYLGDLCASFAAVLGRESEELANYGFRPLKRRRAATVEEKVLRTAKARLTREKRGTLGKQQRRAIQADTPDRVVIEPDGSMHPETMDPDTA